MKEILSKARAAIQKYDMISDGDRIAVGVSGGKDSLILLKALASLRSFYPAHFELIAVTVDIRFGGEDGDFSQIEELCAELSVPYHIIRTRLAEIIFNEREEENPCSLCSRMRRGILIKNCVELGCKTLALGHNLDDVGETFLMNLLDGARLGCFAPKAWMSRSGINVIRPLIFVSESSVAAAAKRERLPVIPSPCPVNGKTEREKARRLLLDLERDYPGLRAKIITAMSDAGIDKWKPL